MSNCLQNSINVFFVNTVKAGNTTVCSVSDNDHPDLLLPLYVPPPISSFGDKWKGLFLVVRLCVPINLCFLFSCMLLGGKCQVIRHGCEGANWPFHLL